VIGSNFAPSKRIDSDTDADRLSDGVDIDRRLRGPGNRNVSSPTEERLDLYNRPANASPVEQIAGPRHGDGG
jgi:hypothetical protein